jgi:hypothetical protein
MVETLSRTYLLNLSHQGEQSEGVLQLTTPITDCFFGGSLDMTVTEDLDDQGLRGVVGRMKKMMVVVLRKSFCREEDGRGRTL